MAEVSCAIMFMILLVISLNQTEQEAHVEGGSDGAVWMAVHIHSGVHDGVNRPDWAANVLFDGSPTPPLKAAPDTTICSPDTSTRPVHGGRSGMKPDGLVWHIIFLIR